MTELPAYEKLQQFLEHRLHALESLQPVKVEVSSSKVSAALAHPARKQDSRRGRCFLCHKDHYPMLCDAYKSKAAEERKRHMETSNLCFNYLGLYKLRQRPRERVITVRYITPIHSMRPRRPLTSHASLLFRFRSQCFSPPLASAWPTGSAPFTMHARSLTRILSPGSFLADVRVPGSTLAAAAWTHLGYGIGSRRSSNGPRAWVWTIFSSRLG